jgi:hypothetical protein
VKSPLLPGDAGYDAIAALYAREGGGPVSYGGFSWIPVQDNDIVKFVAQGQIGTFDQMYASQIVRPASGGEVGVGKEPVELSEPTPTPKPSKRGAKAL